MTASMQGSNVARIYIWLPRGAYGNKEMKRFPRGDEPKERASSEMIWGLYTRMIADSYKNMNFENIGGV